VIENISVFDPGGIRLEIVRVCWMFSEFEIAENEDRREDSEDGSDVSRFETESLECCTKFVECDRVVRMRCSRR
jgi:hypothetical protein